MALVEIPTSSTDPTFEQVTDLGGVDFALGFRWNDRAEFWTMDVRTSDDQPVALGVVLAPGILLLRRVVGDLRPAGEIICTGTSALVGRDELGGNAQVFYVDGDELAAIVAAQAEG